MSIGHVVVVIPAHNERDLLERCLRSVVESAEGARRCGVAVRIVVVLDACSDGSDDIAGGFPVDVLTIRANRVGVARRRGVRWALLPLRGEDLSTAWIASTDADSVVPADWLTVQLRLAEAGCDVMVGTVRPDFEELTEDHVALWKATHTKGAPNGHVHGANLGVRASVYVATGGFAAVDEHEDVELVARARALGAKTVPSDECEVLTSARRQGRTPGGYAGYLREQAERLAVGGTP